MLPNRWAKRLKMQESAQRSLCRLAFVLLAIAPMFLILTVWLWSIMPWSRSWSARAWERRISLNFGVDVHLESVENFAPYCFRFHNVTVKHSETSELIATIPSIVFQQRQATWNLRLQSPQVELEHAAYLVQSIHQRYLCQPNLAFPLTVCSIRDMKLMRETPAMEPIFFESKFLCGKESTLFEATFDLASNDGSNSAILKIERHHNIASPYTGWQLATGAIAIPCTVLAAYQPTASMLGPESTFQGELQWEQSLVDSRAVLQGVFANVRFQNEPLPTKAFHVNDTTSKGSIRVDLARVMNGQVVQADGLVTTDSGRQCELSTWCALQAPQQSAVQSANHVDAAAQLRPSSTQR